MFALATGLDNLTGRTPQLSRAPVYETFDLAFYRLEFTRGLDC
jgi:hypothetical protein